MRSTTPITASLFLLSLVGAPLVASAQAPLVTGLGGAVDLGENVLDANDDGSSTFVDLSTAFPAGLRFYGRLYSGLYVNNNGNVSFGAPLGSFTPSAFPLAASEPAMIAPWWGDVDTRNRAGVGDANLVYWDITPGRIVVTWYEVGYYNQHNDRRVSVQLIITDASAFGVAGAFDVEFRYNRCEWTTGDASGGSGGLGGSPAGAGFDAADGVNYVELPGSRTATVVDLCTTSNVGESGVFRFQVRPAGVTVCGNSVRESGEECDDGNVVNGDGCNERCSVELAAGAACSDDLACRSGFCTDGVCCDVRCDGQCEACAESASRGTCVAVTGAPRGARTACAGQGTTCGGSCDGTTRTACQFPPAGTACDDGSSCSTGDVCDGSGGCAGAGIVCDDGLACTADACSEGTCSATLLAGFCLIDGACVAAGEIDPTSQCQVCDPSISTSAWSPRTGSCDDGDACTVDDVCSAGACTPGTATTCADDGIACTASACNPLTGACEVAVTDGCLIDGACVAAGTLDPSNPCRSCDPTKNTRDWSFLETGTRCAEPSCADGVLTLAAECDGLGTCTPPATQPCMDGRCADATMCMGNCASDAECPADRHCQSAVCVDDLAVGSPCDRDAMCGSDVCADGVCCATACDGLCEACDLSGAEGTCTAHAAGTDPDDECPDAQTCDGARACEAPTTGADAGPTGDGGVGLDGGRRLDGGGSGGATSGGGCGCTVPGAGSRGGQSAALLAIAVALATRRRRR